MNLKSYPELLLRDLPFIESPFRAASDAGRLINDPHVPLPPALAGRHLSRSLLESELREGRLFLVFSGVGSDSPANPVVVWEETNGNANGGRWRLNNPTTAMASLETNVRMLNEWQVTPQKLRSFGMGGMGHLQAAGFDATMTERRADEREVARQDSSRSQNLPLGASPAPATLAAAGTQLDTSDRPEKARERKSVHLEVGIFLDGTLNNEGNIDLFRKRVEQECLGPRQQGEIDDDECERRLALLMGASYANGVSNVAKLGDLYPETKHEDDRSVIYRFPLYMPGAGSKTGAPDSVVGMATGLGETGIIEQVHQAFKEVADLAVPRIENGLVDQLTVDLFGFSRGAAAARHAANDIASGAEGVLGRALSNLGIQWPKQVDIRFIGLFDTVGGIVNISSGDWSAANGRNAPVNLYLAPGVARSVVQFTAKDECRKNFALNSLRGPDRSLPDNFREIMLPGAHSDIGGGYHETEIEEVLLSPTLFVDGSSTKWPEKTMQWDNLSALKIVAENEGWIGKQSLLVEVGEPASLDIHKTVHEHPSPDGRVALDLKMKRKVLGGLSTIYLHCMHDLAKQNGVPFQNMDPAENSTSISDDLNHVHNIIFREITQGSSQPDLDAPEAALLKQRYTHHSDNFNFTEFLVHEMSFRAEPPFTPMKPAPNRQRIVHANLPESNAGSHVLLSQLEVSYE